VIGLVDIEKAFQSAGVTPLEAGDIQPGIASRTKGCVLSARDLHVVFLRETHRDKPLDLLITAVVERNIHLGRAEGEAIISANILAGPWRRAAGGRNITGVDRMN
jgi:hypothetical protein